MFSLQEYQHVHLLWFKKRSFTLVWKPNPPLRSVCCAHLACWRREWKHNGRAAPSLRTRAVWNGRKPGSTEALAQKAPLFTWSVKSFSCYNVLRLAAHVLWSSADHALAQVRPCQIFTRTLSKNGFGRSLEPCIVVPFIHDHHLMLQHDNARPHVARICTQFLEAENIPVLAWPAYSPDMSPIEHVWDALDRRIRQHVPVPANIQ